MIVTAKRKSIIINQSSNNKRKRSSILIDSEDNKFFINTSSSTEKPERFNSVATELSILNYNFSFPDKEEEENREFNALLESILFDMDKNLASTSTSSPKTNNNNNEHDESGRVRPSRRSSSRITTISTRKGTNGTGEVTVISSSREHSRNNSNEDLHSFLSQLEGDDPNFGNYYNNSDYVLTECKCDENGVLQEEDHFNDDHEHFKSLNLHGKDHDRKQITLINNNIAANNQNRYVLANPAASAATSSNEVYPAFGSNEIKTTFDSSNATGAAYFTPSQTSAILSQLRAASNATSSAAGNAQNPPLPPFPEGILTVNEKGEIIRIPFNGINGGQNPPFVLSSQQFHHTIMHPDNNQFIQQQQQQVQSLAASQTQLQQQGSQSNRNRSNAKAGKSAAAHPYQQQPGGASSSSGEWQFMHHWQLPVNPSQSHSGNPNNADLSNNHALDLSGPAFNARFNRSNLSRQELERMRKFAHLNSEKRRRGKMNDAFNQLKDCLPKYQAVPNATKISILQEATRYIMELESIRNVYERVIQSSSKSLNKESQDALLNLANSVNEDRKEREENFERQERDQEDEYDDDFDKENY